MHKSYNIIRPVNLKPKPDQHEERVAELCAEHFQSDIRFVIRGSTTTPDIEVIRLKQVYEIKNIRGNGKHTVEDNLRKASKQSSRIIISLLNAPRLNPNRVAGKIRSVLATKRMPIKSVLLITENGEIVDI